MSEAGDERSEYEIEKKLHNVFNPVQQTILNVTQSLLTIGGNLRDKTFDMYDSFQQKIKNGLKGEYIFQ